MYSSVNTRVKAFTVVVVVVDVVDFKAKLPKDVVNCCGRNHLLFSSFI